jgi:hypothetical protein
MFARISQARVQPDDIAAGAQFLKEVYVPNSEGQEGFRGMMGFFSEDGQFLVAEIYDTVDQIRATETEGWYQNMVELFGTDSGWKDLKGQVRRNIWEVAVSKGLEGTE